MKLVRILSIFMALAFLTGCAAAPAPIPSFKSITHVPTEQVIETIYISSIVNNEDTHNYILYFQPHLIAYDPFVNSMT